MLERLRRANVQRCKESFPTCADWTANDWMTALTGEVGEAANYLKKQRRGDGIDYSQEIANELADVVCYVDLLAAHLGIDLEEAVRSKFNEVSDRVGSPIKLGIH